MRELGERASEEFLPVAQRTHDAGRVAHDESHEAEQRLVGEAVSPVNFLESHAFSNASRPASNRCHDAPSAALTTISNISSSPYFACTRAMSSSVTLYA